MPFCFWEERSTLRVYKTHILVLHLFTRDMASGHCVTPCHPASPRVRWSPPALSPMVCTSQLLFAIGLESRNVDMRKRTGQPLTLNLGF